MLGFCTIDWGEKKYAICSLLDEIFRPNRPSSHTCIPNSFEILLLLQYSRGIVVEVEVEVIVLVSLSLFLWVVIIIK